MPKLAFNPFTGTFDYVLRPGEGQVVGEVPSGAINGINLVFNPASSFQEGSLKLFHNGQRLTGGVGCDYVVSESGGPGTDFDTITLAAAPVAPDVLIVDYLEK